MLETAKYEWPNCEPPREDGMGCQAMSDGRTQFKKEEVSPGKWQWMPDREAMQAMFDREQHRRDLFWALRSRVLTNAEMAEVSSYGDQLNIECGVSYMPGEKSIELNAALLQQFRIRDLAAGQPAI